MTKLEIYGVLLLVLSLALGGAYLKGRYDVKQDLAQQQLAANAKALEEAATAATARASADDAARHRAEDFMSRVDRGLTDVQAKFAKLPAVVLDDRGCQRLTDSARLQWNAIELLPAGSTLDAAGDAPEAMPASAVPPP